MKPLIDYWGDIMAEIYEKRRFSHLLERIANTSREVKLYSEFGVISSINGLSLNVKGLNLSLGKICRIHLGRDRLVDAEVIGFTDDEITIMPYEAIEGISKGMIVDSPYKDSCHNIGNGLLGRVVNPLGDPIDELGDLKEVSESTISSNPLNPLLRFRITKPLDVGVKAINSLLTICIGQRMGIFAESGIGKSVLLGMMTKFSKADVVVVGLIGERGREVKEFIEEIIGKENLSKTVIVASPADNLPLMKVRGASYATAIAEYFRNIGKDVLLIMDSLTRYGQALREISLSAGEVPTTKGFSPTVFSKISNLVERSGNGLNGSGSITAIYTVLIEGEELSDPLADHVRSLVDGHIVLSKALAEAGHYPAIDIDKSISRLMHSVVPEAHYKVNQLIRRLISAHNRNMDMISIGMYQQGSDVYTDLSIKLWSNIESLLCQGMNEGCDFEKSLEQLNQLACTVESML